MVILARLHLAAVVVAVGSLVADNMRNLFLALAALFGLSAPAHAAFAIFQTYADAIEPAVTTCDLNTGNCTGQDAGTGLFTAAVCDGVTNMSSAFTSFNTWARATTTNTNGQLIEAVVTGTCLFGTGNPAPFRGLKKARLMGYGATFTGTGRLPNLGPADTIPGICHKAITDAAGCSARINSVSAGATSVTITNTSYCSRFVAGKWAVVTGFDLQGGYNTPYGYPPNPHFFDYVQIVSTASCAGSGLITISRPLTYSYLSTWPLFNSGNTFEADQGGPATIYALDQFWGGEVDLRGFTTDDASNQSIYQGRSVKLRDVTMNGAHCIIPSQNETFEMINSTGTSCAIEVDKIINNLTYRGTTMRRLMFQSSSTNTLTWSGGSLILDLNGTPKVANVTGLTTPSVRIGPYAYGPATSFNCNGCAITNPISSVGLTEDGATGGASNFYTVSSGVFSYPLFQNVLGVADNGAGKARLTVASTTGWATGTVSGQSSLWSGCTVPGGCTGGLTITVVDATHIDIQYNFAQVTWSGGGFILHTAEQERWAVPGTNVLTTCQWTTCSSAFQVAGVTQGANSVDIATTLAGSYPPFASASSNLRVQMPSFTCSNCTGNVQMTQDFARAPAGIPIFSYSNRDFDNNTTLTSWNVWGQVTSIKINVTTAYAGSAVPGTFRVNLPEEVVLPGGTTTFWNPLINLKQVGLRTITPSGVTCDTGGGPVAGACSGDANLTLPDPAVIFAGTVEQQMPNGTPTDSPWVMNVEFIMDQGVVP